MLAYEMVPSSSGDVLEQGSRSEGGSAPGYHHRHRLPLHFPNHEQKQQYQPSPNSTARLSDRPKAQPENRRSQYYDHQTSPVCGSPARGQTTSKTRTTQTRVFPEPRSHHPMPLVQVGHAHARRMPRGAWGSRIGAGGRFPVARVSVRPGLYKAKGSMRMGERVMMGWERSERILACSL